MKQEFLCPECGRPMEESAGWPGLWQCPGIKVRLNDRPPFRFECMGTHLTDAGVEAFEEELLKQLAKQN